MVNVKKQALTWHDINQLALERAGNNTIVKRAHEIYQRVPGLDIALIRRLEFYDFDAHLNRQRSTVFNADYGRIHTQLESILPADVRGFEHNESIRKAFGRLVINEIDTGRGISLSYGSKEYQDFLKGHSAPASYKPMRATVFDQGELLTRSELVGTFAKLDPARISLPDDVTLAEVHRFVCIHEMQHARNAQTFKFDTEYFSKPQTSELSQMRLSFAGLRKKFNGFDPQNYQDDYYHFVDETICDTAALLHHIKAGGSMSLVQAIADARAHAFVENAHLSDNGRRIYGSHVVLDKILANSEVIQMGVENLHEDDIEDFAVALTSDCIWSRDQFYQHAHAALRLNSENIGLPGEQSINQLAARGKVAKQFIPRLLQQYNKEIEPQIVVTDASEGLMAKVQERADLGKQRLMANGELMFEEHFVDVKAMVKYNQLEHPEFAGPEGERHLLDMRQRYLEAQKSFKPHEYERDVNDILKAEAKNRSATEMQERAPAEAQIIIQEGPSQAS